MTRSDLEETFLLAWRQIAQHMPEPVREYRFHPARRWRFDFAWPEQRVAVEIEGGAWVQGRHTRGAGYTNDCEKYNSAMLEGWRVLRFTGDMLKGNLGECLFQVVRLLEDI